MMVDKPRKMMPIRLIDLVLGWPRIVRIGLVAIFALCVTLSLSPMVDEIYMGLFFTPQTVILPSLVSASFGLLMYVTGWWLMIGTIGEKPAARLAIIWYIVLGIAAVLVVVILLLRGITLLNILND
jgi:hypothetical protein